MGRIDGKVAVVLGAAGEGNMGQVIARRLAREGAQVIVAGRKEAPLRALARELNGEHCICDVTRSADTLALANFARQSGGRLDVAVNCTGWAPMTKLLEVKEEELDKLCALQFKGVYFFLQHMVAQMAAGRRRLDRADVLRLGVRAALQPRRVHRHQIRRRRAGTLFRERVRRQGHPGQLHRTRSDRAAP